MVSQHKRNITCYRIADSRYPIFSGDGAQRIGGRWNLVGRPAIYASQNLSCAMLELRVHLNGIPLPNTHKYIEITSSSTVSTEELSLKVFQSWDISSGANSKEYGTKWLEEKRSLILIVPSIVIPQEKNFIINPNHQEFEKLKASKPRSMAWDKRLFSDSST